MKDKNQQQKTAKRSLEGIKKRNKNRNKVRLLKRKNALSMYKIERNKVETLEKELERAEKTIDHLKEKKHEHEQQQQLISSVTRGFLVSKVRSKSLEDTLQSCTVLSENVLEIDEKVIGNWGRFLRHRKDWLFKKCRNHVCC